MFNRNIEVQKPSVFKHILAFVKWYDEHPMGSKFSASFVVRLLEKTPLFVERQCRGIVSSTFR